MVAKRTEKQKAASRRNLEKARAAKKKGRPYFGPGSYSEHMSHAEKTAPKGVAYFGPGGYDEHMAKAKKAFEGKRVGRKRAAKRRKH